MFGTLGGPELFLILVIALIVFGPRKLPEIGKSVGKMLVEFRRASNDFKRTIEDEVEADKLRSAVEVPRIDARPRDGAAPEASPGTLVEAAAAAGQGEPATPDVAAPAPPGALSREPAAGAHGEPAAGSGARGPDPPAARGETSAQAEESTRGQPTGADKAAGR